MPDPSARATGQAPGRGAEARLLQRLEWTVLKRLDGLLQGDYRSLWRGAGIDLADLREYQGGDDVRHIDWNVTARLQVPHVRQYTEDRDTSAWFLIDLSGSMSFGSVVDAGADAGDPAVPLRSKRALAEAFTAALARVLTHHGNRVGAVLYGQAGVHAVLPPRSGRQQVLQLLARLRMPAPVPAPAAAPAVAAAAAASAGPAAGETGTRLAELFERALAVLTRRSLVFVLSDFISAPGWAAPLGRLAQRHDLLAVRLFDPAELALPDLGLLTVQDAESGEQLLLDTQDPGFRARYARLAAEHEAALRTQLAQAGVDVLELATGDDLLQALLRCVQLRRQRQRLPAPRRAARAWA
ncbi:DUF58 domain-containing protein [Aquabacterium sp. OR-4]|uniref:DUF58 domain-containing protein n=1 Tax=Aquabacterium sp. OR-4 TaxID=2978127 RepID=UPI0021B35D52|nr:DUF58 domain-containing protein [Aquabacterium sp. OR-4]MDT7837136.1 DUF58 domain-containing protein [Aquabacterium sp. OR-4]